MNDNFEKQFDKFRINNKISVGSTEFQINNLTKRINNLQFHFKLHKKDNHSKRGLIILVSKRKKLLNYLRNKNTDSYLELNKILKLRK